SSIGRFLGAGWSDQQASGLQSLVWRYSWEAGQDERHKQALLQYNYEDCKAVRMLVDCLAQIRQDAASSPAIEFAHRPAHRNRTRQGGPPSIRTDLGGGRG